MFPCLLGQEMMEDKGDGLVTDDCNGEPQLPEPVQHLPQNNLRANIPSQIYARIIIS
jgi:hypothetical protein